MHTLCTHPLVVEQPVGRSAGLEVGVAYRRQDVEPGATAVDEAQRALLVGRVERVGCEADGAEWSVQAQLVTSKAASSCCAIGP